MFKIHGGSDPDEWWWVDSKSNPADYCTRGIQAHEAEKWRIFHNGPDFLWKPKSEWPKQKDWCFKMPGVIRAAYISSAATQVNVAPPPPPPPIIHEYDALYEAADRVGEWLVKLRRVAFLVATGSRWRKRELERGRGREIGSDTETETQQ